MKHVCIGMGNTYREILVYIREVKEIAAQCGVKRNHTLFQIAGSKPDSEKDSVSHKGLAIGILISFDEQLKFHTLTVF